MAADGRLRVGKDTPAGSGRVLAPGRPAYVALLRTNENSPLSGLDQLGRCALDLVYSSLLIVTSLPDGTATALFSNEQQSRGVRKFNNLHGVYFRVKPSERPTYLYTSLVT